MVHRLLQAGLVEVTSNDVEAQVVPIRPLQDASPLDLAPAETFDADPVLAMGLPHRTPGADDPLAAHIGDTIAGALAADEGAVAVAAPLEEIDHDLPADEGSWDEKRRVADGNALHHEDIEPTSLDEPRPADPNAAWLADLYAQFIDDPEMGGAGAGKKKRKGDTQALDVAFKAEEVDAEAKVSTLKRLMGALKKI